MGDAREDSETDTEDGLELHLGRLRVNIVEYVEKTVR